MHQIPASVNAFCAWLVALHFWPIFDPSSLKTAEIRHFPSASAAKTVELELGVVAGGAETFLAAWSGVATASAGQPANGHLRGRLLLVHGPPVRSHRWRDFDDLGLHRLFGCQSDL